jgi:hypothetical protein
MPLRPAASASQTASFLVPRGLIKPIPVMTTRRVAVDGMAFPAPEDMMGIGPAEAGTSSWHFLARAGHSP